MTPPGDQVEDQDAVAPEGEAPKADGEGAGAGDERDVDALQQRKLE